MSARTLVVWCPDWPIVAAGLNADVPAAVVFANRVVACSAAARSAGVRRGLRRREAQGRCPDLVVLEQDRLRDARAFEPVVATVEAFAPQVEIVRPGVCAVGTRGPSRYFGGDEALADRVGSAVGHGCLVGVADGVFAATLAARAAARQGAGRRDDGGASLVVPPGRSPAFVASFPVATLDRPELVDLLVRLGIRTLGQLAALPAADVLGRFGPDGAVAHRLARGLDERPLAGRVPPPDLVVQAELDPPAVRVDTAAFVAKSLADELHQRLARAGLACTRIGIEAETEHGERLRRLWRVDGAGWGWGPHLGEEAGVGAPAGPMSRAISERVRWQLDGWLAGRAGEERPTAGVSLLRLVPDQVVPDDGRQLGFWGGTAEAAERAGRALARVQGLLGPEAVVTAVPSGGRGPAEQVTLVSWGDAREPARLPDAPWPGRLPSPAPATVYGEPLPAEVVDEEGTPVAVTGRCLATAAPARLSVAGGRWAEVVAWAGPWPLDERWWDQPAHRRRARFQAVEADGSAWLLALEGGRWWVEAAYD